MGRVRTYTVAAVALGVAVILAALGLAEEAGALSGWQALVLGIVQGLTELLPISSSGHLILVPWLADWTFLEENEDFNLAFDVAVHLGTTVAVVLYFAQELARLIRAWLVTVRTRKVETTDQRIAWFLVIATLPALLIGGLFGGPIGDHLGEPWQIAIFLAIGGVGLWLADQLPVKRAFSELSLGSAVGVGLFQCLALMPGVSRSGITITAGRLVGLDRDGAARFSFLLLIPVSIAAVAFTALTDVILGDLPPGWVGPFVVGTVAAFGSGLLAIHFLLSFVRQHTFAGFAVYRILAALIILGLIASGARSATF